MGGRNFTYALRYEQENGKRKCESLGHTDLRKAERQRAQKEKELKKHWAIKEFSLKKTESKGLKKP